MPKSPIEDLSEYLEKEVQDYSSITIDSDTTINVYPQNDYLAVHLLKRNARTLIHLKMSYEAADRLYEGLKESVGE